MSSDTDQRSDSHERQYMYDEPKLLVLKPVPLVLMLVLAGLLGWFFAIMAPENMRLTAGLFGGIMAGVILGVAACTTSERVSIMIKTSSSLFLVISLVLSLILALSCETLHYYFIFNGVLLVIYLCTVYGLIKSGAH